MTTKDVSKIGRNTKLWMDTKDAKQEILRGVMLVIDPSVGSGKSMPGYAVYSSGNLVESGEIRLNINQTQAERLKGLGKAIQALSLKWDPDVLVIEEISHFAGASRGEGFSFKQQNVTALQRAIGAVIASSNEKAQVVFCAPASWKHYVRETYVKGDAADAIEMGWIVHQLAKHINNSTKEKPKKSRR